MLRKIKANNSATPDIESEQHEVSLKPANDPPRHSRAELMIATAGCSWDVYTQVLQLRSRASQAAIRTRRIVLTRFDFSLNALLPLLMCHLEFISVSKSCAFKQIAPYLAHPASVPL